MSGCQEAWTRAALSKSNLGGVVASPAVLAGLAKRELGYLPGYVRAFGSDSGTPPRHLTISLPDR